MNNALIMNVRRYIEPEMVGIHVISEAEGHHTVGLFNAEKIDDHADRILVALDRAVGLPEGATLDDVPIEPVELSEHPDILAYVRAQIIPLEWKGLSDEDIIDRVKVAAIGAAELPPRIAAWMAVRESYMSKTGV